MKRRNKYLLSNSLLDNKYYKKFKIYLLDFKYISTLHSVSVMILGNGKIFVLFTHTRTHILVVFAAVTYKLKRLAFESIITWVVLKTQRPSIIGTILGSLNTRAVKDVEHLGVESVILSTKTLHTAKIKYSDPFQIYAKCNFVMINLAASKSRL